MTTRIKITNEHGRIIDSRGASRPTERNGENVGPGRGGPAGG
jgi:hypothetical protein